MGKVLNNTEQAWSDALLLRLRMREVPGARIGEVLAEVQSHVAETGEHPREAFGSPEEYADRVADAIGAPPSQGWRDAVRGLTWRDLMTTVGIALAAFLLTDGAWALGAGETAVLGLPAQVVCAAAGVVLSACAVRTVTNARREASADEVVDPRTGANMVPIRRWQVVVLIAVPMLSILLMTLAGFLTR